MKLQLIQFYFFAALLLVTGCKNDVKEETVINELEEHVPDVSNEQKEQDLNISILMDLSDRISPEKYPNEAMEYYQRDVAYIESVASALNTHLRNKRVRAMNDRIQLYFDPEPNNNDINNLSKQLKFHVTRSVASMELLDKIQASYRSKPREIYELAIKDNEYVGSDTWRFFKNKVDDYCLEEGFRNILVVLTDGYIYHRNTLLSEDGKTSFLTPQKIRNLGLNTSKWKEHYKEKGYGFIPINKDLSNLEVLVLGINPSEKNPYELDVIQQYWSDWLESMGIEKYDIKEAALPSDMEEVIHEFILNK